MGTVKLKSQNKTLVALQTAKEAKPYKSAAGVTLFAVNSPRAKRMPDALDDIIIAKMLEIDPQGFAAAYRFKNGNYLTGLAADALTALQVREKGNNAGYLVEMIIAVGGGKRGYAWCMYEQQCAVGIAETLTGILSDFPYSGACATVRKQAPKLGLAVPMRESIYGDVWIKVYPDTGLGHTGNFDGWIVEGVSAWLNEGNTTSGTEGPGGPVVREGGGSYRVGREIKSGNWVICVRPFPTQAHAPQLPKPNPTPLFALYGEKSPAVGRLQHEINAEGYKPKLKVDMEFGPKTTAGVKFCQKRAGLKQTGRVDQALIDYLLRVEVKTA